MRWGIALLLSLCAVASAARTLEEDTQYYLDLLNEPDARRQATEFEALSAMGLSDPRLFDAVQERLVVDYEFARLVRENRARVAWYFRALGFSVQAKYEPTLRRFVDDKTYRNYAIAALRDRPQYEKWNPVISSRAAFDPGLTDDQNRLLNMLRADDPLLYRVAAKRAFLTHETNPAVASALADRLRALYPTATDDESEETAGWLINALGRAGGETAATLLGEVARRAPSDKLKRRAGTVLSRGS